jgi:cytochrome c556
MTATTAYRHAARTWVLPVAFALTLGGCSQPDQPDQPDSPSAAAADTAGTVEVPSARLSVNQLMVTTVDNAGHVLWDAENEQFRPKSDADWLEIEDHAVQLVAAATLIQLPGTGPSDAVWARQANWRTDAQAMGDAAMLALEAAKRKNLDELVEANGALVKSCESCHEAFKPELPTEGLVHQRPHSESHQSNR